MLWNIHCVKHNNIKNLVAPQRTRMEICSYAISHNAQYLRCKDRIMNWKLHMFSVPPNFINYFSPLNYR